LKGRVHVTRVAQVLQTSWCGAVRLRDLGFGHVLQKLHLLFGLLYHICRVPRRRAHHHEDLLGLETQLREVGIILELPALDDELLTFWLDTGDGEELVFEGGAIGAGIDVDFVLLALVLYDYWVRRS
jgi:hypothetical protein